MAVADTEGAPGGSSETYAAAYRQALSREYPPVRTLLSSSLFGDQTMRSGNAFAEVTVRSEAQNEELRPATSRETAAAILVALAESGLDPSGECPWECEIELLEEYLDVAAQVPSVTMPKKH
jgi:hypothetical protein